MDVRPSPIAGRWYPGLAATLAKSVDQYLRAAQADPPAGEVVGLWVPHAGHVFSGAVAAQAFASLRGAAVDSVAILCPSHFHDDGALVTSAHGAFATPLGRVEVDREALDRLRDRLSAAGGEAPDDVLVAIREDREHAIEIELPFLQRSLSGAFTLIPIMIRDQAGPLLRRLGEALGQVLRGRRGLVVASSDLSHYRSQAEAEVLDAEMLRAVESFSPEAVLAAQAEGRGFACGYGAIAAGLWAARELGATRARVVGHATSGDVNKDFSSVVGYGAAVLWKA